MILKRFSAESFRNIQKCNIEFSPGVNLIHGKNAEGKTNAIEGIYIFSRGRSFRAKEDKELVSFGSDGFHISIEYEDVSGNNSLEYSLYGRERRRKKNGYKINKVTDFIGNLRAVIFTPDDLSLIKRGPEERRNFLNVAISQYDPSYVKIYSSYKKSLENRNHILKQLREGSFFDERELYSWTESLCEYASLICKIRKDYVKKIEPHIKRIMKEISDGNEEISFIYKSDIKEDISVPVIKEEYKSLFEEIKEKEIISGTTLIGPHRDDIEIEINGKSAKSFASQGQQRSIVLSMKISEGEVIKEEIGEYPIYIFDDVLSELDEKRQKYVISDSEDKQIIITCCNDIGILEDIKNKTVVRGGEYY